MKVFVSPAAEVHIERGIECVSKKPERLASAECYLKLTCCWSFVTSLFIVPRETVLQASCAASKIVLDRYGLVCRQPTGYQYSESSTMRTVLGVDIVVLTYYLVKLNGIDTSGETCRKLSKGLADAYTAPAFSRSEEYGS